MFGILLIIVFVAGGIGCVENVNRDVVTHSVIEYGHINYINIDGINNIKISSDVPVNVYIVDDEIEVSRFLRGDSFANYPEYKAVSVYNYNREISGIDSTSILIIENPRLNLKHANIELTRTV